MKALLVLCALLLSACQLNMPQADYDPQRSFGQYQRFAWQQPAFRYEGELAPRQNDLLEDRLKAAITGQLEQQGLRLAPEAELLVQVGLSQRLEREQFTTQVGGYWGLSTLYQTRQFEIPMQVVTVDLIDRRENKLIWRNSGEISLSRQLTPERRSEAIRQLVHKLLAEYPPY